MIPARRGEGPGNPPCIEYAGTKKELESGFSVLREAVAAVDGSALGRLERNFARFAAVGTDCFMELAGAVLERAGAPARISLFHWNFTHVEKPYSLNDSIPGFSVLREAVAAIDGSALGRLERNFARFAAVGTDGLMELAGAVLERAGAPA